MTFPKVKKNAISSSKKTTTSVAAKYPMSPLMLLLWDDFSTNVQSCVAHFPDISLDDPFIPLYEGESCSGEAGVHALGDYTLFKAIRILMNTLSKHYKEEAFKNLLNLEGLYLSYNNVKTINVLRNSKKLNILSLNMIFCIYIKFY